jgi:hypothetical protein
MENKEKPEELTIYKQLLIEKFNNLIDKFQLVNSFKQNEKDFIYISEFLKILTGNDSDDYQEPKNEYDLLERYFNSVNIHLDKKTKNTKIKCWNISDHKQTVAHNFYEVIVSISDKKILVLGNIDSVRYEYKYFYRSLYHLERIIKEIYIQNCLYSKYDNRTSFKLKGNKK